MNMTPPGDNRNYYEMEIRQMEQHAEKIKKDYRALEAGIKGADDIRAKVQQKEDEVDENFTQAAAAAARAHKTEFEYPKGSGKMHPVKMDKGTAHEINDDYDRMRELAGLR